MVLEEYQDNILVVARIFTVVQLFSPLILCWNIVKRGSSDGLDVMAFLGSFVLSSLFLQNSILLEDQNQINVNILALSLGIGYLTTYFLYTKEKVKFYIKVGKALIFIAVMISYAQHENPELVVFRFGLICTIIMLALIGAPLFWIREILKSNNTDCLLMPLIVSGLFVSFSWLLYGIAINETFLQIQFAVAHLLGVSQIGLYVHCKLQKSKTTSNQSKKLN